MYFQYSRGHSAAPSGLLLLPLRHDGGQPAHHNHRPAPRPSVAGITLATQPSAPRTDMGIATASSAQLKLPFNVSTPHCGFCQP